jgi:hypothetical protein
MSADEDEAQIETWMIGSGSEPTGSSPLRFENTCRLGMT